MKAAQALNAGVLEGVYGLYTITTRPARSAGYSPRLLAVALARPPCSGCGANARHRALAPCLLVMAPGLGLALALEFTSMCVPLHRALQTVLGCWAAGRDWP